jgi:hypothetical protein
MDLKEMFTKETIAARKATRVKAEALPVPSAHAIAIDANLAQLAELAALKAENEALRAAVVKKQRPLTYTVSPKGALSVYGIGRFPVTLYANQWVKVLGAGDAIKEFLIANQDKFVSKED